VNNPEKESKILQNEATKPNRINKTARKMGQNEAKRSQKEPNHDRHKSFKINATSLTVASF
jgi:hypothetical protein